MPNNKFMLRALQPSDSPALVKLITEFDGDLTTRFQVIRTRRLFPEPNTARRALPWNARGTMASLEWEPYASEKCNITGRSCRLHF